MGTVHSPLVQENDRSVQTSVETVSTTGVAGYTTYTITLHLQSTAQNCYTIYGDSRPLMFPPAYQVAPASAALVAPTVLVAWCCRAPRFPRGLSCSRSILPVVVVV